MRPICLLIAVFTLTSAWAVDPDISDFMAEVTKAVQKQDMSIIERLSYDVDAPPEIREESQASWKELLSGEYPEKGYEFIRVSYVNPPAKQPSRQWKGQVYEYNLEVIAYVSLNFRGATRDRGRMIPIGRDPEGNVRFPYYRIKKD
jgi:hypothetical protein